MLDKGFSPSSIANAMNEVAKEKGKEGDFQAKTMSNMKAKIQKAIDVAARVD